MIARSQRWLSWCLKSVFALSDRWIILDSGTTAISDETPLHDVCKLLQVKSGSPLTSPSVDADARTLVD